MTLRLRCLGVSCSPAFFLFFLMSSTPAYLLRHALTGMVLAHVTRLDGFWRKGRGVLGLRALPPGEGVWLPGVASVHTVGVRFALDMLFLDQNLRTLAARPDVPPGRLWAGAWRAHHTLELGAGTLARLGRRVEVGDLWELSYLWELSTE